MKFLAALLLIATCSAAPDRRPARPQYAAPPPPQAYRPAPQPQYVAAPQETRPSYSPAPAAYAPKKVIAILSQDFKMDDYGYQYNYETEDYQTKQETGKIIPGTKKQGAYGSEEDDGSLIVDGSYYWVAPDGQRFTVTYRADENGFQPQGDHLPVPPQLTPEVAQATAEHAAAVAAAQQQASYQSAPSYQQPQYQPAPAPYQPAPAPYRPRYS